MRRVNLPRWGLKLSQASHLLYIDICVNLPRWGLKHNGEASEIQGVTKCKFTPLGFETSRLTA